MLNEKMKGSGWLITVKSTPPEDVMKGRSDEEKERLAQAVIANTSFRMTFKQPE